MPIVQEIARGKNRQELDRLERERIKHLTDKGIVLLNRTVGNDSQFEDIQMRRLPDVTEQLLLEE